MKPKFNPEINLGHIIQLLTGLIVLVSAYAVLNHRLLAQEQLNEKQTIAIEKLTTLAERLDERTKNAR